MLMNDYYHSKIILGNRVSHLTLFIMLLIFLISSDSVMFMLYAIYSYVVSISLH